MIFKEVNRELTGFITRVVVVVVDSFLPPIHPAVLTNLADVSRPRDKIEFTTEPKAPHIVHTHTHTHTTCHPITVQRFDRNEIKG